MRRRHIAASRVNFLYIRHMKRFQDFRTPVSRRPNDERAAHTLTCQAAHEARIFRARRRHLRDVDGASQQRPFDDFRAALMLRRRAGAYEYYTRFSSATRRAPASVTP